MAGLSRHQRRLLIVDPSTASAETQGAQVVARGWPGAVRLVLPALADGDGPGPGFGYDYDAVVVMGSRASVHDGARWAIDLAAWLGPLARGALPIPLLGICFGHQLLCRLAGSPVGLARADGQKISAFTTTFVHESRLVAGPRTLSVIASHRESVTTVPAGFTITGRRPDSAIDMVEHRELPLFGVQFHPEAREEFAQRAGLDPQGLSREVRESGDALIRGFHAAALAPA